MREDALPHPLSPYGVTKLAAEHLGHLYAANHKVPATAVRYFTVYGPRQRPDMAFHRFLRAAAEGAPIVVYGDGEQTRDFTFVGDAVAATILAADQVLELIAQITGRTLDVRREPPQKGDMRDTYADTSLARADLGFAPATSLADGLAAEYRWLTSSPVLA
jgi:nucleoside-diphosphate-sugar epimerase